MKKVISIALPVIILLVVAFVVFARVNTKEEITPHEMLDRIEKAIGDEFEKQHETEVVATLAYGNGNEESNINYYILKTTYSNGAENNITGLNTDALRVLFDPDLAESCQTMSIQDWDAALYKTSGKSYLCWTCSPEVSYALEYNPDLVSDEDIIKMGEGAEPIKSERE